MEQSLTITGQEKDMDEKDFHERIERELVRLIMEIRVKKKLSKAEVGRRAFPDRVRPERKIQAIEKKSYQGKPQKLSLRDAHFLAYAVGEKLHNLLLDARRVVEKEVERELELSEDKNIAS